MNVFDYISIYGDSKVLLEISLPTRMSGGGKQNQMQSMSNMTQPQSSVAEDDGMVEFETLKKYLLYNSLKEIKYKLRKTKLDKSNPTIERIYEFIDLVLDFYNSLTYTDCKKLIDRIIDMIILANKVQVPSQKLDLSPELDSKKVQSAQSAQAQSDAQAAEQKRQTDLQDHLTAIQKRNAELDLLSKRIDVGLKMHQAASNLKQPVIEPTIAK